MKLGDNMTLILRDVCGERTDLYSLYNITRVLFLFCSWTFYFIVWYTFIR